jgi:cytidine diphosphoramidate kinase
VNEQRKNTSNPGVVVWITGLSGSGKSTLANGVKCLLRQSGKPVVLLDGDSLRTIFKTGAKNNTTYDRASRLELALKYSNICRMIALQGINVVIATISLFTEVHSWNRRHFPAYFEVYLKVSIKELRRRDPKGIYKRFDSGKLKNVAGLDIDIDEPDTPDLLIQTDNFDINSSWAKIILHKMTKKKLSL